MTRIGHEELEALLRALREFRRARRRAYLRWQELGSEAAECLLVGRPLPARVAQDAARLKKEEEQATERLLEAIRLLEVKE